MTAKAQLSIQDVVGYPLGTLRGTFNHVALPPKRPASFDNNLARIEESLASRMLRASDTLVSLTSQGSDRAWKAVTKALESCWRIHQKGVVDKKALVEALQRVKDNVPVIVHVSEQNAGLLIRYERETSNVIFEAFEASPRAEDVLGSAKALRCNFPGTAVSIPLFRFRQQSFIESLASFLEQASAESIKQFAAKARKAGVTLAEIRDTVDPALITQMLMALLEALGERVYPPLLQKRLRDDVCWSNAERPWRRSAFWLVIRVCVQRILYAELSPEWGCVNYKFLQCVLHTQLLQDCAKSMSIEEVHFLRAKLCRRLAKLEAERTEAAFQGAYGLYRSFFDTVGQFCEKHIQAVSQAIDTEWSSYKNFIRRRIPSFPLRASDNDLHLTLPNSSQVLQHALNRSRQTQAAAKPTANGPEKIPVKGFEQFLAPYYKLFSMEEELAKLIKSSNNGCKCYRLARLIVPYLELAINAYNCSVEQKSLTVLLVFEAWKVMDACAVVKFPLLKDYHPGFLPGALDVLQLPRLRDMKRLQKLQEYLDERRKGRFSSLSIFSDPEKNAFPSQYCQLSAVSAQLEELEDRITDESEKSKEEKLRQMRSVNTRHENLCHQISQMTCSCIGGRRGYSKCDHCRLKSERKSLHLGVHEDFLPSNEIQLQAILFELTIPEKLHVYRETTWRILSILSCPRAEADNSHPPKMHLADYGQLRKYRKNDRIYTKWFGLASDTKSFLVTHYKGVRPPASEKQVVHPFGLRFSYHDAKENRWAHRMQFPATIAHLFALNESALNLLNIKDSPEFAADARGPSSHEIIVSQSCCPPKLTVHQATAYKSLLSTRESRWLCMLRELGSANLNFSLEETMHVYSFLCHQAGPMAKQPRDKLRLIHVPFEDDGFCTQMLDQIRCHLEAVSPNWRETHYMSTLLILVLRVCTLGSRRSARGTLRVLEKIRRISLEWIRVLRQEVRHARDSDHARHAMSYALASALICKRTFFLDTKTKQSTFDEDSLSCFIEASIAVQENLYTNPSNLSTLLKGMLIRDLAMTVSFKDELRQSVEQCTQGVAAAIDSIWPEAAGNQRSYGQWSFLSSDIWWLTSETRETAYMPRQRVHFHLLEGHLLIDYQPIGRLPRDIQESPVIQELFHNQVLSAYPSAMPGMTYAIAHLREGHQVHAGRIDGKVVVRARIHQALLEFVERSIFRNDVETDLPGTLIEGYVHWLNLDNGHLEFRNRSQKWGFGSLDNWILDFPARRGYRQDVSLVNPLSELCRKVTKVFEQFENPGQITVYQPSEANLTVELKRMDLEFCVNERGSLESKQLRCMIDTDQDAGTWYGLQSMLVLRDVRNQHQRSVMIPMGSVRYELKGHHVAIRILNNRCYGQYSINSVLGRLQCAPDPQLLLLKAQLHAYTSFPLPDTLTGRTGTEEALTCLSSAGMQPWMVSEKLPFQRLIEIARLTPRRVYYPPQLKRQQTVRWNKQLTTTIQHDAYRTVVERILHRIKHLASFTVPRIQVPELDSEDVLHLRQRSHAHRQQYERLKLFENDLDSTIDHFYEARHGWLSSTETNRVYEIALLINTRPSRARAPSNLKDLLEKLPYVRGYNTPLTGNGITDLLELNVGVEWGPLTMLCRSSRRPDRRDDFLFRMATVAFSRNVNMEILRSALAFFLLGELNGLSLPKHNEYVSFGMYQKPELADLKKLVEPYCTPFNPNQCPTGSTAEQQDTLEKQHNDQCQRECEKVANTLLFQWPAGMPSINDVRLKLVNKAMAMQAILDTWRRRLCNREFANHLDKVQRAFDRHQETEPFVRPPGTLETTIYHSRPSRGPVVPSLLKHLINRKGPNRFFQQSMTFQAGAAVMSIIASPDSRSEESEKKRLSSELQELRTIIDDMNYSTNALRKQYGEDLMTSLEVLVERQVGPSVSHLVPALSDVSEGIKKTQKIVESLFQTICDSMTADDGRYRWLNAGFLYPCLNPVTLLENLRSTQPIKFGSDMRQAIDAYGLCITRLQHLLRIYDALTKNDNKRLGEELATSGHENWEVDDNPDWLLLEIDSNFLIREQQVEVAHATIAPASGANSVLQMNMGQGKTSVILPMVACALANKKSLSRLIVPRALLLQTAQVLQSRLGGLVGREICHVPFSRKTPTTRVDIENYWNLHKRIRNESGVILTLPEHVLSFRLSGIQALYDGKDESASSMIKMQSWLDEVSRDVIDECDFTLAVRTQLIYPSGPQFVVDGHPHRWRVTQLLLAVVDTHLDSLQETYPQSIKVVRRTSGGFPLVYFPRPDVEQALRTHLVDDICEGRTNILPLYDLPEMKEFLLEENVLESVIEEIVNRLGPSSREMQVLYLLRGLLVHGILLLCLQKRWNVQYGLHPGRDPIAVPFHAKGVPSDQAEWGHPDVAIMLTCLAFYHNGLTIAQLRQGLVCLLRSDDPSSDYNRWTEQAVDLPDRLRKWNLINVDDGVQIAEIWSHLRYQVEVINYYLCHFVFPVHAKQFKYKLQMSGWDIPIFTTNSIASEGSLTTGFSGTNDNRQMLPLTIQQDDLPGLAHTNAEVLTYLLQERNRNYVAAINNEGNHISEMQLLAKLKEMGIRLLIDAGAHILEFDNKDLVRAWLDIDQEAPAAVYFNHNRPSVFYRNGKEVSLLASPFVDDLKDCLVYMDEAHTRGTDLKFPVTARGALTLSLGQTKDHTVQAAMRLRQLGTSQSIVFVASPEAHRTILDHRQKEDNDTVEVTDVIYWLLEQTCRTNEQIQHLYLAQGFDFCTRQLAARSYSQFFNSKDHRSKYLQAVLQHEKQTLKQLYHPTLENETTRPSFTGCEELRAYWNELARQQENRIAGGLNSNPSSAFEEVEQEREVVFEVEQIREKQEPPRFEAEKFEGPCQELLDFARTGRLKGEGWYETMYAALARTRTGQKCCIRTTRPTLVLVSREFTRTIKWAKGSSSWRDDFLRPLHWILWCPSAQRAMVVIPEEAEAVLPILQTIKLPKTHLITYAPPITRQMMKFSEMRYYTIPTLKQSLPTQVIIEIGLLAGRLYFEYDDYAGIMAYMGMRVPLSGVSDVVKAHVSASSKELGWQGRAFCKNVTGFLEEWLAATRTGQDFGQTPMGYVSQGRPLRNDHPFFARITNDGHGESESESGSESLSEIGSDESGSSDEDNDSDAMEVDD